MNKPYSKLFFYGHVVYIKDEADREDAKTYLYLWKKFFIQSLPEGAKIPDPEDYSVQFIERQKQTLPGIFSDIAHEIAATSAIKLCVEYSDDPEKMPKANRIYNDGMVNDA